MDVSGQPSEHWLQWGRLTWRGEFFTFLQFLTICISSSDFDELPKSFLDNTLARQANHQSGKEKKGSVLGRFLGRKKVNTWVDACLGQLCISTFGSDMQTTEDYYACPVTSNSIILTLWNPLLYKYSGRNTRWKWKTNIFEFDEILVAMNSLVSYAFNCKNKMGWQCWLIYRKEEHLLLRSGVVTVLLKV